VRRFLSNYFDYLFVSVSTQYFNSTIRRAWSLSLVTSASDLWLRTNKFCSLLFVVVVHAGCDKLMRGGLCGKLHGGQSQLLFTLQRSSIDSHSSRIAIYAPATPATFDAPVGGWWYIAMTFGVEKLEWRCYPTVKKNWRYVYSFNRMYEHDRQTDRQTPHDGVGRPHLCIASRGNN